MSKKMKWRDAAELVLKDEGKPMHYTEVAQEIFASGLRQPYGKTPAITLYSSLYSDIQNNPETVFVRVARGMFGLKKYPWKGGKL